MIPQLATSMREAWNLRRLRAADDLLASMLAPALFTPEFADRAAAEIRKARAEVARWTP